MSSYVPVTYRKIVIERAESCCEYCLIHQEDAFLSFEIDHIISEKHGGETAIDNLAYTCFYCNRFKGSDIGSVLLPEMNFIRFYHPRIDVWSEHFELEDAIIHPKTDIGKITAKILKFNEVERIMERQLLIQLERYPR